MTDDAVAAELLDELYGVPPERFTARRKELVTEARKRGDTDAAAAISAARRPTMAAWALNSLVRNDPTARTRLAAHADALREAHAAMDGPRIRELTVVQRKLIGELALAAFSAVGMTDPTGGLRDDVTDTLQAVIADPDVASRFGYLTKAERWSGFGDFGAVSEVLTSTRRAAAAPAPAAEVPAEEPEPEVDLTPLRAEVEAARAAHAAAVDVVAERKAAVATARRRYEQLLEKLAAVQRELDSAAGELDDGERTAETAAVRLDEASAALRAAKRVGSGTGDDA